jgi:hypothetical protein
MQLPNLFHRASAAGTDQTRAQDCIRKLALFFHVTLFRVPSLRVAAQLLLTLLAMSQGAAFARLLPGTHVHIGKTYTLPSLCEGCLLEHPTSE